MAYQTSSDLPPALASLLNVGNTPTMAMPPMGIATAAMPAGPGQMPSYQVGGMVGPGGMPIRAGASQIPMMGAAGAMPTQGMPQMQPATGGLAGLAPQGTAQQNLRPEQIIPEAQRFVQQHPQQVQQIMAQVQQIIQSGEISAEDLNLIVQMARTAATNPSMYPQLRQIAIQRGLADPEEISEQFDAGLIFVLVLLGEVMQAGMISGQTQQGGQMPSFKRGGMVPGEEVSRPVVAQVHEGEYVIPAHIVRAKGTEFFDKMLQAHAKPKD
jgi:hypothetical protein